MGHLLVVNHVDDASDLGVFFLLRPVVLRMRLKARKVRYKEFNTKVFLLSMMELIGNLVA